MKNVFFRNTGIMNSHHGAIMRHNDAGPVPGHTAVKAVSEALRQYRIEIVNEFFHILSKDKVLLALFCGMIIAGVALGGFIFMAIATFVS
jgi:hypothetical protein